MPERSEALHWIQLYLLAQMRASDFVSRGLHALGEPRDALAAARGWAKTEGLETICHSIATYVRLLGEPAEATARCLDAGVSTGAVAFCAPIVASLYADCAGKPGWRYRRPAFRERGDERFGRPHQCG